MTQEADNPFGRLVVDVPECIRLYARLTSENNVLLSEVAQLAGLMEWPNKQCWCRAYPDEGHTHTEECQRARALMEKLEV